MGIGDADECRVAAAQLNYGNDVEEEQASDFPAGCYLGPSDTVYFNDHGMFNNFEQTNSVATPICQRSGHDQGHEQGSGVDVHLHLHMDRPGGMHEHGEQEEAGDIVGYAFVTEGGLCSDNTRIGDADECRVAAAQLNIDNEVVEEQDASSPAGCYYVGRLATPYFNDHGMFNNFEQTSAVATPICQRSGHDHTNHHAYASCEVVGAAGHEGLTGRIHFRQDWESPDSEVELGFDVSGGLSASTDYEVHVHKFGDTSNHCANIGDMFMPFRRSGHGRHQRSTRQGHGHNGLGGHKARHGGRGGYIERLHELSCDLGDKETDASGALTGRELYDEITLIGPSRYILLGRSLAIRTEGPSGVTVGCCSVVRSAGSYWQ